MSVLDRAVREAREELGRREVKGVDWKAVDRKLFDEVAREQRAERDRFSPRRGRGWAALAAATAAGVLFVVGARHAGTERLLEIPQAVDEVAGTVASIDGQGQVRIAGAPAARGTLLHVGDVIDARDATAVIERTGKLTLRVERGTRATVTHAQGTLILALAEGAVEAQVVPVPIGEAFAVDVAGSRVAVHGTHLRVARDGGRVLVDLNEGVVSVGQAPRIGSLLGTLVTAPGHAEFNAASPSETLTVTHDPAAVRAPVLLSATSAARAVPQTTLAPIDTVDVGRVEPSATGRAPTAAAVSTRSEPHTPAVETKAAPAAEANAENTLAKAVLACMAERPRAENVTVVVRTTLHLELAEDGSVRAARFEPPVAPDVNTCAAASIYRVRFAAGGNSKTIPIDFEN
jgi:ferric-dicitrate binding protein FerR (iron transport regulator)